MRTGSMIQKLQKQAHAAELKALAAKHKLTSAQVKRDLGDALKDLKAQMAQEVRTVADAVPRRAVAKRGPRKGKKGATVDVAALLAAAKRK